MLKDTGRWRATQESLQDTEQGLKMRSRGSQGKTSSLRCFASLIAEGEQMRCVRWQSASRSGEGSDRDSGPGWQSKSFFRDPLRTAAVQSRVTPLTITSTGLGTLGAATLSSYLCTRSGAPAHPVTHRASGIVLCNAAVQFLFNVLRLSSH